MKKMLLVAVAAAAAWTVPASAITAFATFTPQSNLPNIAYDGDASGNGTLSSLGAPVTFNFLDPLGMTTTASFDALMNLTATTTSGTVFSGIGILPVTTGTLSFTSASAVTYMGKTGTNLLTVNFSGGSFTGLIGGSTATYGNSTPPNSVTFTSDFIDFSTSTARDLALAINAINPLLSQANTGGNVADFTGTVSGNFGTDAGGGIGNGVPEPTSWALMIGGFAMVGAFARRRSPVPTVAA